MPTIALLPGSLLTCPPLQQVWFYFGRIPYATTHTVRDSLPFRILGLMYFAPRGGGLFWLLKYIPPYISSRPARGQAGGWDWISGFFSMTVERATYLYNYGIILLDIVQGRVQESQRVILIHLISPKIFLLG